MLVDDFAARSDAFAAIASVAHVVRVPFEVCPWTPEPDGVHGLWWKGWDGEDGFPPRRNLIPRKGDTTAIDCSWWRPPFPDMIVVSERREQGAMIVMAPHRLTGGQQLMVDGVTPVTPDWAAIVALVAVEPHLDKLWCLLAMRVFGAGGTMYDCPLSRASDTQFLSKMLSGLDRAAENPERLEAIWNSHRKQHELDVGNMMAAFTTTCALMCCKNVEQVPNVPDRWAQRTRKSRGKLPLVTWHTLKVRALRSKQRSLGSPGKGDPLAVHWVRGHFKHYTAERPLLGRAVGTYWWSPHLAGRAERVVLKDYEVDR